MPRQKLAKRSGEGCHPFDRECQRRGLIPTRALRPGTMLVTSPRAAGLVTLVGQVDGGCRNAEFGKIGGAGVVGWLLHNDTSLRFYSWRAPLGDDPTSIKAELLAVDHPTTQSPHLCAGGVPVHTKDGGTCAPLYPAGVLVW